MECLLGLLGLWLQALVRTARALSASAHSLANMGAREALKKLRLSKRTAGEEAAEGDKGLLKVQMPACTHARMHAGLHAARG